MKYTDAATKAAEAGLPPATIGQTCALWQTLGITRQTSHLWKSKQSAPLEARMAAAWHLKQGHEIPNRLPPLKQCPACFKVLYRGQLTCDGCGHSFKREART